MSEYKVLISPADYTKRMRQVRVKANSADHAMKVARAKFPNARVLRAAVA